MILLLALALLVLAIVLSYVVWPPKRRSRRRRVTQHSRPAHRPRKRLPRMKVG